MLRRSVALLSLSLALSCQSPRTHQPPRPVEATSVTPAADAVAPEVRVAVGGSFACAVRGGRVSCWGSGSQGQLGDGRATASARPVLVRGLDDAIDVVASSYAHACALRRGGTVACWGANESGQLGDGTRDERHAPVEVPSLAGVRQLSAGNSHTCAVLADDTVRCWGRNYQAQLGDGTWDDRLSPVAVTGVRARRVGAGSTRTCVTSPEGAVTCWGGASKGSNEPVAPTSVTALPSGRALGVSSSFDLTCVLAVGQVHCLPGSTPYSKPGVVAGVDDALDLSVGGTGACVVRGPARSVACWDYRAVPEAVPGLATAERTAQGNGWGCAVRVGGQVACWGNAGEGQLGDGSVQTVVAPVAVRGLDGPVETLVVGGHHSCAVGRGGARCWGHNATGALGDGTAENRATAVPVVHAVGPGARWVAGDGFTCALDQARLRCWGRTSAGEQPSGPVDVSTDVVAAVAHQQTLCLARTSGQVTCTIAFGRMPLRDITGFQVAGAAQLVASTRAVCTLQTAAGRPGVTCAGLPYDGPIRSAPEFVPEAVTDVPGVADAVEIALAGHHLVARRRDGSVVGVALARDTRSPARSKPALLGGLSEGAVAIAPFGDERFCAVRGDGSVLCAAADASAQPPQLFDVHARGPLAGGAYHACVALAAGGVMCWGDNTYGQIGAGAFGYRAAAVDVALGP